MTIVAARHILVDSEEQAQDLMGKIEGGASFEDLAKEHSKCPSGKEGGFLGNFPKGVMVKEFEEAVFSMDVGSCSGPVKTQFGHHLIQRVEPQEG